MKYELPSESPAVGSAAWHKLQAKLVEEREEREKEKITTDKLKGDLEDYQGGKRLELKRGIAELSNAEMMERLRVVISDFEAAVDFAGSDWDNSEAGDLDLEIERAKLNLYLEVIAERLEASNLAK